MSGREEGKGTHAEPTGHLPESNQKNTPPLLVPLLCFPAEAGGHGKTENSPEAVAAATGGSTSLGKSPFPTTMSLHELNPLPGGPSFPSSLVRHYSTGASITTSCVRTLGSSLTSCASSLVWSGSEVSTYRMDLS